MSNLLHTPATPISLTERVNALTEIMLSLTRFRDEAVANLSGVRELAQKHAERIVDAAAQDISKNNQADIEQRITAGANDIDRKFLSLREKAQCELSSRADAMEKRILAERQKAVTLEDVRPELEKLVTGAIDMRRVELSQNADDTAKAAVKVALEKLDMPMSAMRFRGNWNADEAYSRNDVVFYRGGSWVANTPTKDLPSTKSPSWIQLAAPGGRGPEGPVGPQGATDIGIITASSDIIPSQAGTILTITTASDLTINVNSLFPKGSVLIVAKVSGCSIIRGNDVTFLSSLGDSPDFDIFEGGTVGVVSLNNGEYALTGDISV